MSITDATALITAEALDELVTTLAKSKVPAAVTGAVIREIHAHRDAIIGLSRDTVAAFIKLAVSKDVDSATALLEAAITAESLLDRAHARTARSEARRSIKSIRGKVFQGLLAALMALASELVYPTVMAWLGVEETA